MTHTESGFGRISALTFLATLLLVGILRPTTAAAQEDVEVACHRGLSFNGRPLAELVSLPAPELVALPAPPAPPLVSPPHRRRVSADRLLGGKPVTDSIDALTSILDPGHEVIVWDEAGRKTRGRASSVSGQEVVVTRRRRFFGSFRPPEELVFGADSITRVEIVDSVWEGGLIGAGAGAATYLAWLWNCSAPTDCTYAWGLAALFFGGVGSAIGSLVDYSLTGVSI